ncbi:Cytosolic 10-Formyltetrahydrofolate Dehydrogenase [Manis pentadactyla]|nr:Cytosolic 10-Formyltetrahydrofolate Dehydrogenase [Manis pentadactyla]
MHVVKAPPWKQPLGHSVSISELFNGCYIYKLVKKMVLGGGREFECEADFVEAEMGRLSHELAPELFLGQQLH